MITLVINNFYPQKSENLKEFKTNNRFFEPEPSETLYEDELHSLKIHL